MKQIHLYKLLFMFFCTTQAYAQLDSVQQLDEVIINDSRLNTYSEGYKLTTISDTIIEQNSASLTNVLRYNTTIYFKENGYGMVSSPSFRGTNASQTAVVWNGISINSNLTGQTDFNTILPSSYNDIIIRSGGGSTQYGSGAVGGSIHLNNFISFKKRKNHYLKLLYGSFASIEGNFKTIISDKKNYFDLGIDFVSSENDYKYLGLNKKNENGEFTRFNISANTGFKFKKSILIWNANYFLGNRNFSGSITAPSTDAYNDVNVRNLVSWQTTTSNITSTLKGAYLFEQYRYYPNNKKSLFSEGKSNTFLGDYILEYRLHNKFKISSGLNYTYIKAEGDNIGNNNRNTLAALVFISHKITDRLSYGINLRQEFLNNFNNPFLFALDAKYKTNTWYTLKLNASKNYRVPTFNDLYWVAGGNNSLNPEISYQAEIGNEFTLKKLQLSLYGFYINSNNLIKWQPNENGLWTPLNIAETENYGAEISGNYTNSFKKHQLSIKANYTYTTAIDKEKNKQLIYVPYHKITGLINYTFKQFSAYYQVIYNGKVFTTTDNIGTVKAYSISGIGLEYEIKNKSLPIILGIKTNNILNTYYENVAYRPMPNRNFKTFIIFKF